MHMHAALLQNLESEFAYQYMAKFTAYFSFYMHDLPAN